MTTLPRGLLAAFIALLLLVLTGGAWFFRSQERQHRQHLDSQLQSIAQLKSNQIVGWRKELLTDAEAIAGNPFVAGTLTRWFAAPDPAATAQILAWFGGLQQHYGYSDLQLLDTTGAVRLSLSGNNEALVPETRAAFDQAMRASRPTLSDLHQSHPNEPPHMGAFAPIFADGDRPGSAVGCLVLRSNAAGFLYPMIQSWPVESRTAETLLVRRDGNDVLFLNELRHRRDTALRLRIPVANAELPAAMAVAGKHGLADGRDYRGEEVIALTTAIPDSSWFMVTKIDAAEALADWRLQAWYIIGLTLAVGLCLTAGLGVIWQRYRKKHYQAAFQAEAERRESEARYRTTLMSVGDGVIACDRDGRVKLLNPVAEVLTGWSQADACGRPVEEVFVIVNEDTRLPVENPVNRVLREGIVVGLANHTSLITPGGVEFPIADSGAPIFDDQQQITGAVLVFRDQTEERRAEAALRRLTHLLQRAEEMAGMGCWEFDFKTRTVWASPSARRIYGLSEETWTIEEVQTLPLAEYRPALNRALKALVRDHEPYDMEFRIRRPTDGALVEIRSQAEYNPGENKIFGVIHDITEQRRIEAAIRESESRYRSLFQSNHAVMLLVDPDSGMVVDANPAAVRYYGWSREALLGKRISEINTLSPEEIAEALASVQSGLKNSFEFKHRRADGSVRDVEVYSGPLQVAGENRIYSIVHDVTDRKQAEEQRERLQEQLLQAQKLESVGRLAGGVAHDLNNLLSPILGYSDVLLMDLPETDDRRKYVQYIIQAGVRARDLVRQLLAFGRKQTLVVETVDLNELAAGFAHLLRRTVREDIGIEMIAAPALPTVRVDTGQIEQVIMNLVVNAQDAMPQGGRIVIETAAVVLDQEYADSHADVLPGPYVQLTVSDTGCGMSDEVREQIFAPFFTTKEKGKGTGLGLATAYGIVKQHGGHIWVYSEPDQGTTFKIYLPAAEMAIAPQPVEAAEDEEHTPTGGAVMVVEDNDMVRQLTVDVLNRRGYTVLEAASGAQCLELIKAHAGPLDLLLTDVVMPEMNGKALYKQAVQLRPGLKVLYMSGYTENVIASRGVLDQGVNFIQKPFAPRSLAAKVREVLAS